jgi:hypothetical protein
MHCYCCPAPMHACAAAHLAAVLCAAAASGLISFQCSTSSSPGVIQQQASCSAVRPHHGNRHWSQPGPRAGGGSARRVSSCQHMACSGDVTCMLVHQCGVVFLCLRGRAAVGTPTSTCDQVLLVPFSRLECTGTMPLCADCVPVASACCILCVMQRLLLVH